MLVTAADKLHNARAILSDYRTVGDDVFARFSASKEDVLRCYTSLVEVLRGGSAPKRLVDELATVVGELTNGSANEFVPALPPVGLMSS